jgi:hypothetical protein
MIEYLKPMKRTVSSQKEEDLIDYIIKNIESRKTKIIDDLYNKIGRLQYEINCLGLDKEELTGVSIRIEELKALVKNIEVVHCCKSDSELLNGFLEFAKTYENDGYSLSYLKEMYDKTRN